MTANTDNLTHSLVVLERALRLHQELNHRGQAAAGVTLNQAVLLAEIEASGDLATGSTLSRKLGRAPHTVTAGINGIEKKRLVERRKVKGEDRRVIRIGLTDQGASVLVTFRASSKGITDYLRTGPLDAAEAGGTVPWVKAMVKLLNAA